MTASQSAKDRGESARASGVGGAPCSHEVGWATAGSRRLDVKSAHGCDNWQLLRLRWRLQQLIAPGSALGGDVFPSGQRAVTATVALSGSPSEEVDLSCDAESLPPLRSSSGSGTSELLEGESSSGSSGHPSMGPAVAIATAASDKKERSTREAEEGADKGVGERQGVGGNRVCACCGSAMDRNQAPWDHARPTDYCYMCGREPLCRR